MKEALGAQDLDQVYGAVAIKKRLDEKSDYADNSPLMAVNPYAENLILLQYLCRVMKEIFSRTCREFIRIILCMVNWHRK